MKKWNMRRDGTTMHVGVTILTILASLRWGDWKTWRKYQASMMFIATGGLLYEYIVREYTMWKFHPDFLLSHEMVVIVYAVITMPISIFLFLSHFPENWWRRIGYIILWSGIYIAVEWVLLMAHRISYQNGWHFWFSLLFDLMMFSVIAIHQHKPGFAYLLSLGIIALLIKYFDVPFKYLH